MAKKLSQESIKASSTEPYWTPGKGLVTGCIPKRNEKLYLRRYTLSASVGQRHWSSYAKDYAIKEKSEEQRYTMIEMLTKLPSQRGWDSN